MPTLTDLSTIRDLCARYDFALSKGFGQNFIINPGICPRIAEAAGIGPGWGALEVGPGIGVLTEQLCKRADNVVSIEVDKRKIALSMDIKAFGTYPFEVKFYGGITASMSVAVCEKK